MKPKDQDEKKRGDAEIRKDPDQRTMERAHEKEEGGFVNERRAAEAREEQERLDQVGGEPRRIEPAPVPGMSPKTRR